MNVYNIWRIIRGASCNWLRIMRGDQNMRIYCLSVCLRVCVYLPVCMSIRMSPCMRMFCSRRMTGDRASIAENERVDACWMSQGASSSSDVIFASAALCLFLSCYARICNVLCSPLKEIRRHIETQRFGSVAYIMCGWLIGSSSFASSSIVYTSASPGCIMHVGMCVRYCQKRRRILTILTSYIEFWT